MAGVLFGRPKVVQIAIIIFSMTAGVSIVKSLPRMDELSSSEGGIQGRLAAWGYGYERMHNGPIGWQNFVDNFAAEHGYRKASHSAYVQIGAEFGKWGLFLFIAIFYSTMRTILFVNTKSLEEERIRRMLFVLSVSFFMSSWVIDFATRSTLFMIPACVAAFHRQLLKRHERDVAKAKEDLKQFEENPDEWNGWADLGLQDPSTAARSAGYTERIAKNNQKLALESLKAKVNEPSPIHWPKVNAVDFIVVFLVTRQSIWLWGKVLEGNF